MSSTEIDTLNDVLKTMIDSYKGYEMALQMADERPELRTRFMERATERNTLINALQGRVRALGGEPETDGGAAGAMHRGFTQFSGIFREDAKAALGGIDDGEEHLAKQIQDKLEDDGAELSPEARDLLSRAHASACEGQRFADMMGE